MCVCVCVCVTVHVFMLLLLLLLLLYLLVVTTKCHVYHELSSNDVSSICLRGLMTLLLVQDIR